ncbi:hypothetical protein AcW2_006585 [Taiwanofungus camphoratus]|nr:hypothetical protein AcW2_006585 [Antrodia cinnamomea]
MSAGPSPAHGSNVSSLLSYLDLAEDYQPSPDTQPIDFLFRHFRQLPPHLLSYFSTTTTPKQRSLLPSIRNRRLRYAQSNPPELNFTSAKTTWPTLWPGREPLGREQGEDERTWVEKFFMGSLKPHVGKLGMLLGGYEEERESERVRILRRQQAELLDSLPEEDSESSEEEPQVEEEELFEDTQALFMRRIREHFIYGLLESIDYDKVDWDEKWDADNDRDAEERWFDDEEESNEPPPELAE